MTKFQKSKRIILHFTLSFCILTFAFCIFSEAEAAKLNLTSQTQEVGINQEFQVDLLLDTENESVNAVEGKIVFPETLLELEEIKDGNSIINFWIDPVRSEASNGVERPSLNSKFYILYSGITPGGYLGKRGLIFSAVFRARAEGKGAIEIRDAKVLLNDGEGTGAPLKISNYEFLISNQIPISQIPISKTDDNDPPEAFIPEISQDPNIFDGKYFLVFATQDKGSGIDHYEIQEGKGLFIIAESPYLLQNQELNQKIFVKAIDKSGNERIAAVEPRYPIKWYKDWRIWVIIILGVAILYIFRKILWQKKLTRI